MTRGQIPPSMVNRVNSPPDNSPKYLCHPPGARGMLSIGSGPPPSTSAALGYPRHMDIPQSPSVRANS